ncbi:glycosyltransferase family 2 protein [Alicyclobacillus fodiniaquatilis]|uniref:Glycosyltransferase family 2 protein n=1 Tax=Alicyclobacillus fodiniaquatilis TaxID=1661150 RepID=A0ABW4JJG9_9BACL
MKLIKLSLAMIAKDSESTIGKSLQSVKQYVDEMVVVDTGSVDGTARVAKEMGADVFTYAWKGDFSDARNCALSKASGDYCLVLDADEWIEQMDLAQTIKCLESRSVIGQIQIRNYFDDAGEMKVYKLFISRIMPNGVYYTGRIHEQIASGLPRIQLPISAYHVGYYKTNKGERNIGLLKKELASHQDDVYLHYQIAREYRLIKEYLLAMHHYEAAFSRMSRDEVYYADFIVGWLYTAIQTQAWELALRIFAQEQNFLGDCPDFWFVYGQFCMQYAGIEQRYFGDIERAYLQCLTIGETSRYGSVEGTGSFLAMYNLGVFYEVTGQQEKSIVFYGQAAALDFQPAQQRLFVLKAGGE